MASEELKSGIEWRAGRRESRALSVTDSDDRPSQRGGDGERCSFRSRALRAVGIPAAVPADAGGLRLRLDLALAEEGWVVVWLRMRRLVAWLTYGHDG